MKMLPFIFVFLSLMCACSGAMTPEEYASWWAKNYYEALLRGDYKAFLAGKDGADSIPDTYREQLLVGYKQFMIQQEKSHHGINDIRIVTAKRDTTFNYMNVFLMLCFGDSTNEQVSVPMVERNGIWKMK